MNNPVWQAIESRTSAVHFAPDHALSDDAIASLVQVATRAPSAYNFQNWRFIAVRTPKAKARLKAIGHGQQKLVEASVVFIICGRLAAQGLGLASCPMIGFDMAALAREFELDPMEIPAIVVAIGRARASNPRQKWRKPIDEVLSFL